MRQPVSIPKRPPWISQILVIRALLGREVATRFGKYKLGLFWMLMEPLIGALVIGVIIGTIARRSVPEIPYSFFVLNGFLLLALFKGPMTSGVNAIGANQGLLVYPNVRPLDTFLARFIFEFLTTLFSFVVFCLVAMWIGVALSLEALDLLMACFILTWLIGCGFGMVFGIASAHFKEVEKLVPIVQRPLLFISAVLFPTSVIPESSRGWLLWNPLVHTIELSRTSLFPNYSTEGANLSYPTVFAIVVVSLGLALFHINRNFLSQN